jgi:hypothetical protein
MLVYSKHLLFNIHGMNIKVISLIITMVIFIDIYVFCFSILVSIGPQKFSLMWYTSKNGVATTLCHILDNCSFVFDVTHTTTNSLTLHNPMAVVYVSSPFCWLVDDFLALLSQTLSGEGSYWCGELFCRKPLGHPISRGLQL